MKLAVIGLFVVRVPVFQRIFVGVAGLGTTSAPTLFDAAEGAVCQVLRFARAENVYPVPTVRPVKMQDVAGLVTTHCFEASWVAVMV